LIIDLAEWALRITKTLIFLPRTQAGRGTFPGVGSEFTSKAAELQGGPAETASTLNVKLWDSVRDCLVVVASYPFPGTAEPTEVRNFAERIEPLALVYASVLRALPPAAPPASPVAPARGMIRRDLYTAAIFLLFTYTIDSQPTGFSVPAFAPPSLAQMKPTMLAKNACQEHNTDIVAAPAPYVEVSGAELMAAPVMGGGAPAEDSAPTEGQRDKAEDGAKISFGVVRRKHPQKNAIVTCAPW
jgi:hypothetical protein